MYVKSIPFIIRTLYVFLMKVNDQTIIFKIDNCAHYSVASCLEVDIVEILTKGNKILY